MKLHNIHDSLLPKLRNFLIESFVETKFFVESFLTYINVGSTQRSWDVALTFKMQILNG